MFSPIIAWDKKLWPVWLPILGDLGKAAVGEVKVMNDLPLARAGFGFASNDGTEQVQSGSGKRVQMARNLPNESAFVVAAVQPLDDVGPEFLEATDNCGPCGTKADHATGGVDKSVFKNGGSQGV